MPQTISRILGVGFLLVGIAGFFNDGLLGMHLSPIHNVIHIASGALALYFGFAASPTAATVFCLVFGGIYLVLGILGFVAPDTVGALLHAEGTIHAEGTTGSMDLTPDNIVHMLIGGLFLLSALISTPRRASADMTTRVNP